MQCPDKEDADRVQHCYREVLVPIPSKKGSVVFQGDAGGVCVKDVAIPTVAKKRAAMTVAMSFNVKLQLVGCNENALSEEAWTAMVDNFPPLLEGALRNLKQKAAGTVGEPSGAALSLAVKEEVEQPDDPMQEDDGASAADASAADAAAGADNRVR